MTKPVLAVLAILCLASFAAPAVVDAQTFKVEKFDIKGEGGTDYVTVEPATGRVFVSRSTHMMVVDGATGKVVGDIPNTPGVHGAGIVTKAGHGFTTNSGDQTVTMFDLKTLAVLKQIKVGPGLDGIMYDEPDDKVILTNHSRPIGTLTALDPKTGDIVATVELEDTAPEGAAADGKGRIFVNNEGKNTIQVIDVKTWKATASWPLAPCEGPTGIAYDKASNRIFSGCSNTSVVLDAATGKVVASITNGTRVDALGWDPTKKLIYIPNGGEGTVTVVHQDSPDRVHGGRDGADLPRREDHHRRSGDAQRVSLPARTGPGSGAAARCAASSGGRARPRPARADHRGLVHRHEAVADWNWGPETGRARFSVSGPAILVRLWRATRPFTSSFARGGSSRSGGRPPGRPSSSCPDHPCRDCRSGCLP